MEGQLYLNLSMIVSFLSLRYLTLGSIVSKDSSYYRDTSNTVIDIIFTILPLLLPHLIHSHDTIYTRLFDTSHAHISIIFTILIHCCTAEPPGPYFISINYILYAIFNTNALGHIVENIDYVPAKRIIHKHRDIWAENIYEKMQLTGNGPGLNWMNGVNFSLLWRTRIWANYVLWSWRAWGVYLLVCHLSL